MIEIQKFMTLVGRLFEDLLRKLDKRQKKKEKENRRTKIRKL